MSLLAGHYELLGEVGDGPIARLSHARVRGAGGFVRRVAVRQLTDPAYLAPAFVSSLARTASRLGQRSSPHIEQVLDIVADDRRLAIVTEWVGGMSLSGVIDAYLAKMQDVPWPVAVEVAIQALRGLEVAHGLSIRHDALTAKSVRIAHAGTVKLTRFGVGAALEAIGVERREREELGLRHSAPELIDGASPDARTDQYGVGALLFTLLAGEPPFDEPPGADRDLTVMTELPDLAVRRPDVPPLLVATVERALRVVPEARFESVADLARALRQLLRSHLGPTGPELLAEVVETLGPPPLPDLLSTPSAQPRGIPQQSTMHVDVHELTELAPPSESGSAPPPTASQRPLLPPAAELVDASDVLSLPDGDEPADGAEPLPLTTRSAGLSPARTEHLDAGELVALTLEDADDAPSVIPPRPSVRVPLGLGPARTEMLDDRALADLRIDDDDP